MPSRHHQQTIDDHSSEEGIQLHLFQVLPFTMEFSCDLVGLAHEGIATEGSPYWNAVVACAVIISICWVTSILSRNYSQVDKIWSIMPFVYTWFPVCDTRTFVMASLATIWGLRLTWNFNRRGGYHWPPWQGDEDYRWEIIRNGGFIKFLTNPVAWHIFNFGFISLYQNLLLLAIAAPSYVAYTMATSCESASNQLHVLDYVASGLFLSFLVIESLADNDQYTFQTEKYRLKNENLNLTGEYADGFKQSGLYSIVRKPNYAAEQSIWISFYLFTIASGAKWNNWAGLGCVLLVQLFALSGWFTEKITRTKYPAYNDYMKRVPLYIPNAFSFSGGTCKPKAT